MCYCVCVVSCLRFMVSFTTTRTTFHIHCVYVLVLLIYFIRSFCSMLVFLLLLNFLLLFFCFLGCCFMYFFYCNNINLILLLIYSTYAHTFYHCSLASCFTSTSLRSAFKNCAGVFLKFFLQQQC